MSYIQFYVKGKVLSNKPPYEEIGEEFIPSDTRYKFIDGELSKCIETGIQKAKSLDFPAFRIIGRDFSTTLIHLDSYGKIDLGQYFDSLEYKDKAELLDYKTLGKVVKEMYPEKWMNIRNDIIKKFGRKSPQFRGFEVNFNPDRYCNIEVPF